MRLLSSPRGTALGVLSAAMLLSQVATTPSRLLAQANNSGNYKQWEYDEKLKRHITAITKILIDGTVLPEQQDEFDNYYVHYSVARWTVPENQLQLPRFRKDSVRDLNQAKLGNAHVRLTDLLLKMMTEAAFGDDFDPVVRVNAMLMLGDLNLAEAPRLGAAPTPLPNAVAILVCAVREPKVIDPVRVAALAGLLRHAVLGIASEAAAEDVTAAMLDLLRNKSVAGRSADGNAWMQARAIEVLGLQGGVGSNNMIAERAGRFCRRQQRQSARSPGCGRSAVEIETCGSEQSERGKDRRRPGGPGGFGHRECQRGSRQAGSRAQHEKRGLRRVGRGKQPGDSPWGRGARKSGGGAVQLKQMFDALQKAADDNAALEALTPMAAELKTALAK